jgi:hypothetical protein
METVFCLNCYDFFLLSPRHKDPIYCMKPDCRRAQMKKDPQFSREKHLSNQKWVNNNQSYWTDYRKRKPEKAEIVYFNTFETSAAGQTNNNRTVPTPLSLQR